MDKKAIGKSNLDWGKEAEQIACDYLTAEGYAIRERNWRSGNRIEIDIIAQKGDTIVFVEVKARKGNFVTPDEAVDANKRKMMQRGGDIYLRGLGKFFFYRLDIITITGTPSSYRLDHLKDAFLPSLS